MEIVRIEEYNDKIVKKMCEWNYNWWGIRDNKSIEEVEYYFKHCLCNGNRLPQTFVAIIDGEVVGMYSLSMHDDLEGRPDIYPWLINVYVDENYRGKGVCREMMNTVNENAKKTGLKELYLYTKHVGLYEKFGWEFLEEVPTFRKESPIERLYRLQIV